MHRSKPRAARDIVDRAHVCATLFLSQANSYVMFITFLKHNSIAVMNAESVRNWSNNFWSAPTNACHFMPLRRLYVLSCK